MPVVAQSKEKEVKGNIHPDNRNENTMIDHPDGGPNSPWMKLFEDVAEKGGDFVKSGAHKVGDFTSHAATLAKLKLEAHQLNNQLCTLMLEAGHIVWELHKTRKLDGVEGAFLENFKEISRIERKLWENQNKINA